MKVVIISDYWENSQGGGIKNYLINLVNHLNSKNIEVNVLFREGDDSKNFKIEGSKFTFIKKSFSLLRKIKPDVVHTHEKWYCLLAGCLYKKFYDIKLIHTFHTIPTRNLPKSKKIFFNFLIGMCDSVTFSSQDLIKKMNNYKGIKCVNPVITRAGIEYQETHTVSQVEIEEFRELHKVKKDSVVLLAQGFMSNELKFEGAKLLLRALKNIVKKYPNTQLILTGNGLYLDELKKFSEKISISENVIFTGFVQNPFIPLEICDIYVHTPLSEGFSLALLEAMMTGKPIVATAVGGIPEAINNEVEGLLIDPDIESIVKAISYLLENKDFARKMGYNAKKSVEKKFTWEKTVKTFIDLYTPD